jgi:predicted nuclease with TOPRIM domain
MSKTQYNPACSICRDLAGKDRAGVSDKQLCVYHLRSEHDWLESRVRELEDELDRLKEEVLELKEENEIHDQYQPSAMVKEVARLRARHAVLVEAIIFIKNEWENGSYSPEWFMEQPIVKEALAEVNKLRAGESRDLAGRHI